MFDQLLNLVFFLKLLLLVSIAFYAIFSGIIFIQVQVMNKIITIPPGSIALSIFAFVNTLTAIALFILAIMVL